MKLFGKALSVQSPTKTSTHCSTRQNKAFKTNILLLFFQKLCEKFLKSENSNFSQINQTLNKKQKLNLQQLVKRVCANYLFDKQFRSKFSNCFKIQFFKLKQITSSTSQVQFPIASFKKTKCSRLFCCQFSVFCWRLASLKAFKSQ